MIVTARLVVQSFKQVVEAMTKNFRYGLPVSAMLAFAMLAPSSASAANCQPDPGECCANPGGKSSTCWVNCKTADEITVCDEIVVDTTDPIAGKTALRRLKAGQSPRQSGAKIISKRQIKVKK